MKEEKILKLEIIKEKLTLLRLFLSLTIIAIFGIVGWTWINYSNVIRHSYDNRFYLICIVAFFIIALALSLLIRILTLFKKIL